MEEKEEIRAVAEFYQMLELDKIKEVWTCGL